MRKQVLNKKTVGIMQPYFFPYIGYFQLIETVDEFVIYDNIQYTKKGWINRNRLVQNGKDTLFSLPLKKDSDYLDIRDREISESFSYLKFNAKVESAYRNAPYFSDVFPLIKNIIAFENNNLFQFVSNSIELTCDYLNIETNIKKSSDISIDHNEKAQNKVINICIQEQADTYINPIGGLDLYSKNTFIENNIDLKFIKTKTLEYPQKTNTFIPSLSIIDVMMFNSPDVIKSDLLTQFELV